MTQIFSATLNGVTPIPVEIEADLSPGMNYFEIVGLPDACLRESKTRVKSAIIQSGFEFPNDARLVLNLAPSRIRKEGSGFELALAMRILQASGQILFPTDGGIMAFGELGLDGSCRSDGKIEALSLACLLKPNIKYVVVPKEMVSLVQNHCEVAVVGISHLRDLLEELWWEKVAAPAPIENDSRFVFNFDGIKVSETWAQILELTIVGGTNILVCGPPGTGKTFFADLVHQISTHLGTFPKPDIEQKVLDCLFSRKPGQLPFSSPHHSSSQAGLVGGCNPPQPGAISQAHGGILFMDELLEFGPKALDALREPLEKGRITVQRSGNAVDFPSRFQLIAATNPCRCGYWKHPFRPCQCTAKERTAYFNRISGPLLERFHVRVFIDQPLIKPKLVAISDVISRIQKTLEFKRSNPEITVNTETRVLDSKSIRTRHTLIEVARTLAFMERSRHVDARLLLRAMDFQTLETRIFEPSWPRVDKNPKSRQTLKPSIRW